MMNEHMENIYNAIAQMILQYNQINKANKINVEDEAPDNEKVKNGT